MHSKDAVAKEQNHNYLIKGQAIFTPALTLALRDLRALEDDEDM